MGLAPTLALASALLAGALVFGWLGARPRRESLRPRLRPWPLLMVVSFLGLLLTLTHLASLLRPG